MYTTDDASFIPTKTWPKQETYGYTNADLKIPQYVCVHIKTIPCKVHIPTPKNSRDIYVWSLQISLKVG